MATRIQVMLLCCLLSVCALSGCQRRPFISDMPRTPYERYMALRGRERPETVRGPTGAEQRNARERLQPLEP
jgi:hypothetical protein